MLLIYTDILDVDLCSAQYTISLLLTLAHLSAHVVNRLLRENWKSIPIFFNGKKIFKNVTLQILNFILIR